MADQLNLPGPLWLLGCGNMAGAMLAGWLDAGLDPAEVTVIRPSGRQVADGVRVVTAPPAGDHPAILILGVKPQKIAEIAPVVTACLGERTIMVSILAGVELATLRRLFPQACAIVRAMPNLPVRLREGVIGLYAGAEATGQAVVERLMAALGLVEWLKDERQMDVLTALAGSGPAFLYRFIDALAEAGTALGLPREQAARLAMGTVVGAAASAAAAGEPPAILADRVASPGGSTRAGLNVLDEPGRGLLALVQATLQAAVQRNREMAEEARRG